MNDEDVPALRLAVVASAQGGCFSRRQATDAGYSGTALKRILRSREWIALHPGVYTWSGVPIDGSVRAWAAVVACQERDATRTCLYAEPRPSGGRLAAVSHRSAAALIGTRAFSTSSLTEVSLHGDGRPRLQDVVIHRMGDLGDEVITSRYGPPCTIPARTLLDLPLVVSERIVRNVLEEWLADRKVKIDELRSISEASIRRGRLGPRTLLGLLDDRALGDQIADSDTEAQLAEVLKLHGVPLPQHHLVVGANGLIEAELDYAYPEVLLALEVNGYGVHLRSRGRWQSDLDRHNWLTSVGWAVLYYSKSAITRRSAKTAAEIDQNLRERVALFASMPRA